MKKNMLWSFIAGVVITLVICISFTVFNNLKKENRSNIVQFVDAFSELDRALYDSAANRFEHKDYKGALKDIQTSDEITKVIHRDNPNYKRENEAVKCLARMVDLNDKIKKNPNDYKLYYERAMVQDKPKISLYVENYSFCSDYKSAVNDYEKANELNPESNVLPFKFVGFYISDGQYDKALNLSEKLSKTDREGFFGMAICYYKFKQYEKVIENLDKYIAAPKTLQNPDLPESPYRQKAVYSLRAKANFKLHRYKDGLKDLKKAV